ncbi:MAG: hypothetical protein ABI132_01510 [Rhodanobacteraceae bacterium]
MKYFAALAAREDAMVRCLFARQQLSASVNEVSDIYRAYPLPALAGAAGIGFLLAQLRVGGGLVMASARLATGPTFGLIRRVLQI